CSCFTVIDGLSAVREVRGRKGGSVSVQCHYELTQKHYAKYWCKGQFWSSCSTLLQTGSHAAGDKVSISDDKTRGIFTVTMSHLEKKDEAWYWCGIKRGRNKANDKMFYLYLYVDEAKTTPKPPATTKPLVPATVSIVSTPRSATAGPPSTESSSTELITHSQEPTAIRRFCRL
ncbi:CLM3 protein, partial [Atractosteus spatula]|nr:CLM3 protein [Atractosteus spatula]